MQRPLRFGIVRKLVVQFWHFLREVREFDAECLVTGDDGREVSSEGVDQLQNDGVAALNVTQRVYPRVQLHVDGLTAVAESLRQRLTRPFHRLHR